ncbi:LPFR motif small protein [Streptomyces sp. NBC_00145]|uniref:LPFR motif small protein n=1 Tax=Streptomyces sp. NBC_00145 TaxID=2975666 RepID=UPI002E177EBB
MARGAFQFTAISDFLRAIGGAIATVVTLSVRAVARLFGGAADSARGRQIG